MQRIHFLVNFIFKLNICLLTEYFVFSYSLAVIFIDSFAREKYQTDFRRRREKSIDADSIIIVFSTKKIYSSKGRFENNLRHTLWKYSPRYRRSFLDALKASSSHALRAALATLLISYIPCENYLAEFTLFRGNAPCEIMKRI